MRKPANKREKTTNLRESLFVDSRQLSAIVGNCRQLSAIVGIHFSSIGEGIGIGAIGSVLY